MRLLHLLRSLDPATGGPIEAVRLLSLEHAAAGHAIEIASLDAPGDPVGDLPFPLHLLGPASGVYGRSPRLPGWLRANSARFDAVIVNGLWQYHGYACRRALKGSGTPYFVFPHGMLDPWFKQRYPLKHLKKWLYWPWGEYPVLRDASAVFFTCAEEKRLAPESFWLYRTNAVVTGLGAGAPQVDLALEREQFFVEYPHLRGKRIVLFMGRLHPKKGCDLLIEAFAQVCKGQPQWALLMVGPDQVNWQVELQALAARLGIAGQVTWAGPRMGESKWGAFAAAEVFALPSHQENFGIAVAEALACGTPVVISSKVNIWREIEQEGSGIVQPDTLDGTVQSLRTWAATGEAERAAWAARARICFDRHFDIRACAEAVLQAIQAAGSRSRDG